MDILRFMAALLVVIYHYFYFATHSIVFYKPDTFYTINFFNIFNFNLSKLIDSTTVYGYLGVQIFFVISGFIILYTAENKSAREFIISRVSRLWPAIAIGSTISYILYLLLGHSDHLPDIDFINYIFNFFGLTITPLRPLFATNFIQTLLGSNLDLEYFDGAMWTLSREVGFYLMILMLIFFKQIKNIRYYALIWIFSSLMTFIFATQSPNYYIHGLALYLQMDYACFFTIGIFAYLFFYKNTQTTVSKKKREYISSIIIIFGFVLSIVLSIYNVYDQAKVFNLNQVNNANPIIASMVFILAIVFFIKIIHRKKEIKNGNKNIEHIYSEKTLKYISIAGGMSYTLYIIHQFNMYRIIANYNKDLNISIMHDSHHNQWTYTNTFLALISIVIVTLIIYIYLEKPLIKWTKNML